MRARCFPNAPTSGPGDPLHVRPPCGDEIPYRVAAELLPRRPRDLERDASLGDDSERLHRGDVGTLDERLAGSPVSRSAERSGRINVGSGFIAARTTISSPLDTPASSPPA